MKSRKFLVPLAVTVAALTAPHASQGAIVSSEPVEINRADEASSPAIILNDGFVISRSVTTEVQTAYHRSHMSHRSHSSHQSHYSGY